MSPFPVPRGFPAAVARGLGNGEVETLVVSASSPEFPVFPARRAAPLPWGAV